jgi:hypothetical protein
VAQVVLTLEAAGVEFTNGGQPGVRLRKRDLVKGIGAYRALVELPDDVSVRPEMKLGDINGL